MIVVKTVYELEPRISSCIVMKTDCQASRSGSEPTESVDLVADRNRVRAPRGRRGWPRVAGALPSAAKAGSHAPSSPQHPPALSRTLISPFRVLLPRHSDSRACPASVVAIASSS